MAIAIYSKGKNISEDKVAEFQGKENIIFVRNLVCFVQGCEEINISVFVIYFF